MSEEANTAGRNPMVATRVTPEMMARITERVESRNFAGISEYLRDLIRSDLEARRPVGAVVPDDASADADLTHRTVIGAPDGSERRVA